jgi:osmotically-inducible protein OsmY
VPVVLASGSQQRRGRCRRSASLLLFESSNDARRRALPHHDVRGLWRRPNFPGGADVKNFYPALSACALVVGLAVAPACNRGPDVKKTASDALDRAQIQHVNLDWDKDARVLHMKGEVPSDQERARAEQVVTQAVGTSGKVANELTIKGVDSRTADDLDGSLRSHIRNLIDEDAALKKDKVNVDVNNGVVTLKGDVANAHDRQRAYELASQVPGVKEVVNSLEVRPANRS